MESAHVARYVGTQVNNTRGTPVAQSNGYAEAHLPIDRARAPSGDGSIAVGREGRGRPRTDRCRLALFVLHRQRGNESPVSDPQCAGGKTGR
jgi:hypothetical protein